MHEAPTNSHLYSGDRLARNPYYIENKFPDVDKTTSKTDFPAGMAVT